MNRPAPGIVEQRQVDGDQRQKMPRVLLDRLGEDVSRIRKRPDTGNDTTQMLDGMLSQVLHLTHVAKGLAR